MKLISTSCCSLRRKRRSHGEKLRLTGRLLARSRLTKLSPGRALPPSAPAQPRSPRGWPMPGACSVTGGIWWTPCAAICSCARFARSSASSRASAAEPIALRCAACAMGRGSRLSRRPFSLLVTGGPTSRRRTLRTAQVRLPVRAIGGKSPWRLRSSRFFARCTLIDSN